MRTVLELIFPERNRDPARISDRLRSAPTKAEVIVVVSIAAILVLSMPYSGRGIDWEIFDGAAGGDYVSDRGLGYYYAYWLLPLFGVYGLLGQALGGLAWSLTNVFGMWFAARVFGANPALVLAGFGALSGFYTGTITGVALAALAGMWWMAHEERWIAVGAVSLVAVAKPQWGVPLALLIVAGERRSTSAWVQMAAIPVAVATASFAAYGWWPAEVLDRAREIPPEGNGSLWSFVGPGVAVLWLGLLLPMERFRRLGLAAATAMLAVPYVQQYDYPVLWVFAGDPLGLVSHSEGVIDTVLGERPAQAFQTTMPLLAYSVLLWKPFKGWVRRCGLWRAGGQAEAPA